MNFLFLIIGFVFLVKGADLLVDSASRLAKMFGVPAFIVGLSVVAFGTSAPEAAIGISSAIKHTNQITLGDVIGSSIVNIALVIGLTSVILPLKVEKAVTLKEIPFSLIAQVLLLIIVFIGGVISRIDGAILFVIFLLFVYYIGVKSRQFYAKHNEMENGAIQDLIADDGNEKENITQAREESGNDKVLKLVGLLLIGLIGLVAGGSIVVESSVNIAHMFGLSETLIGLTIVALGTSLPELVTCVVAALRKEEDIAVGNIIGSNIFNIVFVLGASALIYPIKAVGVGIDIAFMITSTVILFTFAYFKQRVARLEGSILILFYLSYIIYKIAVI